MLYAFGRDVCPVDTHVWRVMQRLGFAPRGSWSEARSRVLEDAIPPELRGSLHVTLIAHGRSVCTALVSHCERCGLVDLCRDRRRRTDASKPEIL
jgi:endonuclease III